VRDAMAMESKSDWKLLGEIKGGGDHTKNCQQAGQSEGRQSDERGYLYYGSKGS